jgi:hypothetical protein
LATLVCRETLALKVKPVLPALLALTAKLVFKVLQGCKATLVSRDRQVLKA